MLPVAWALTVARGVISPGRQMRRASIDAGSARPLLHLNVLFSAIALSFLSAAPFRAFIVAVWPQRVTSPALLFGATWPLFAGLAIFLVWAGVLLALTSIERLGVQFYSRRRGWRVTPAVSLVATAHASGAWLLAAAFAAILPHALGILSTMLPAQLSAQLSGFRIAVAPSGFIAGMVWFEIATFLGIRSSRFANPPDAGSAPA